MKPNINETIRARRLALGLSQIDAARRSGIQQRQVSHFERGGMVRFSPIGDSAAECRWKDLLVSEHLALETMIESGVPAVESRIVNAGGRVFLETTRFDRVGLDGRRGIVSLFAFDAEHFGYADDWVRASIRLESAKYIDAADAIQMRWMFSFGRMIGNTDMHFGNLSLFADTQTGRYRLAPAYDVLPMLYAPIGNEVVERTYEESAVPHPDALDTWKQAVGAAASFWRKVADHPQISSEFRDIAQENLSFFPREAARPVPSIS